MSNNIIRQWRWIDLWNNKYIHFQMAALIGVSIFSFGGSFILFKITGLIIPLRVSEEQELIGLDLSQHGEGELTYPESNPMINKYLHQSVNQ